MRHVEIECAVIAETDKAYKIDDGKTQAWVPKSQVEWTPTGLPRSEVGIMVMPSRLAIEKGLV